MEEINEHERRGEKASFWATKRVPVKVKVSFRTSEGKKVSFMATKRAPKKVKVSFWASYPSKGVKKRKKD